MTDTDRIDLAHAPGFALGRLSIKPGTREVVRDDGESEVLEPRVMQVLVALARTNGGIVTRDELSRWCWEDRVVGEDAINRVISRLRRTAEGIGEGAFRVETITKVGYRLAGAGIVAKDDVPVSAPRIDRRLLLGGAGAVLAAGAAGAWWFTRPSASAPTPEIAALMQQAITVMRQGDRQGQRQGIGIYRRVVALQPDYADGWGALALAYAEASHAAPPDERAAHRARAAAAAKRALALDPHNGFAHAAQVLMLPRMGNWGVQERGFRAAIADHPDDDTLVLKLAVLVGNVGRPADTIALLDRVIALNKQPSPLVLFMRVQQLWAVDRIEEADRAMDEAMALFPGHFAVWFTRLYLWLYTGRAAAALAFCDDHAGRPTGIPDSNFDLVRAAAAAVASGDRAAIAASTAAQLAASHQASGYAENAVQFASFAGDLDTAFAIANALYFGRGFETGALSFSKEQGSYTDRADRRCYFLFLPPCAAMRADPRFDRLVGEIGLKRYWQQSGTRPDYWNRGNS